MNVFFLAIDKFFFVRKTLSSQFELVKSKNNLTYYDKKTALLLRGVAIRDICVSG
jgi:hypothetical protein